MLNKNSEKFLILPMLILMFAQIGTSSDNSVLTVAAGSLTKLLNANTEDITFANLIYPLCAGPLMVFGGMTGLVIGWKKNFRLGLLLIILGEIILCTTNDIFKFIWVGRILVGIGASLVVPSILGLVPCFYSGKQITIAFGAIGAATGIATGFSPIIAGILIDKFNYKVGFGFICVYFIILFISSFLLPKIEDENEKIKLDVIGVIIAFISIFSLMIGIIKLHLLYILFGIIMSLFLIYIEKNIENKKGYALIPQSFIVIRQVRNGLYASFATFYYIGGMVLPLQYLLNVVGYNAMETGIISSACGLTIFIFSFITDSIFKNLHPANILKIGYLVMACGSFITAKSFDGIFSIYIYLLGTAIGGAGFGIVASQASTVVAAATIPRDAKQSGGIQATARNIGQAMSIAILGVVFSYSINEMWNSKIDKIDFNFADVSKLKALNMQLYSDDEFKNKLINIGLNDSNDIENILKINEEIRNNSIKNSMYVLAGSYILFLFGTGGIIKKVNDFDK